MSLSDGLNIEYIISSEEDAIPIGCQNHCYIDIKVMLIVISSLVSFT